MAAGLNTKRQATLEAIFTTPVPSDIRWKDVEKLVTALLGDVEQRRGSRVALRLEGAKAVIHRPHPEPTTDRSTLLSIRKFLINAGVRP